MTTHLHGGTVQIAILIALLAVPRIARGAAAAPAVLRISSVDGQSRTLTMGEIGSMPQAVRATDEKGVIARYEGVPIGSLLEKAGAPFGAKLHGAQMRLYVLVEGSDGYAVVFAPAEFDAGFGDKTILLADRCDGRSWSSCEGPFRVIVAGETRRARWVRKVVVIEVCEAR